MAYSSRIPPIKVKLSTSDFNSLVEILNIQTESEIEEISIKSSKIKDKILKYSVPLENEDGIIVDIRFYPNEIVDVFYIIFNGIKDDVTVETDYFEILKKGREDLKKNKFTEE